MESVGLEQIIEQMRKSRSETLNFLEYIQEEDWEKRGRYFTGDYDYSSYV